MIKTKYNLAYQCYFSGNHEFQQKLFFVKCTEKMKKLNV